MFRKLGAFAVLVLVAATAVPEEPPLAIRVETQSLGQGHAGTVVGVVVEVAPEDHDRLGERTRVDVILRQEDRVVDRQSSVVAFEQDGTALLYYDWEVGSYELEVRVQALDSEAGGLWIGPVDVRKSHIPFSAPQGATADAIALEVTAPAEGGVEFLPPPDQAGIGGIQLEVEVPETTATVEFFHDGEAMSRRNRPPWTVSVALGDVVRRTVVRAVARDAKGRYLGEDAIVLNNPTGQLGVEILIAEPEEGADTRAVTVSITGAKRLQQITLDLDDSRVARWADCPCVVRIPTTELEQASILTAEAVDSKGVRGDAVFSLAGGGGFIGSIRVEVVELPVVALNEGGTPITGLEKESFRVFEDDTEVAVEGFGTNADLPLSLALAVDVSGSMIEEYPRVREIVSGFAEKLLQPGDETVLITFSWEAKVQLEWTHDFEAIDSTLLNIRPDGGTSLHDAVIEALEQFRGRRGRQALVVLTDGEDTTSRTGWSTAQRYAHTMRIPVFAVGLGIGKMDFTARSVLRDLAAETGGAAFFPKKVTDLPAVYARIDQLLRSQYLLWYTSPSDKPVEEFRQIRVELVDHDGTVRTIRGYYPGK